MRLRLLGFADVGRAADVSLSCIDDFPPDMNSDVHVCVMTAERPADVPAQLWKSATAAVGVQSEERTSLLIILSVVYI